jgi:VIT1/CCC1 family predicted Fe2+/Mn2+ transporter
MNDMTRWSPSDRVVPLRRASVRTGMAGAAGALIMVVALAAASLVAVVFAATLAVVMALATALLALTALAWRARPRAQTQRAMALRRAGHAWVAYGWDRATR